MNLKQIEDRSKEIAERLSRIYGRSGRIDLAVIKYADDKLRVEELEAEKEMLLAEIPALKAEAKLLGIKKAKLEEQLKAQG